MSGGRKPPEWPGAEAVRPGSAPSGRQGRAMMGESGCCRAEAQRGRTGLRETAPPPPTPLIHTQCVNTYSQMVFTRFNTYSQVVFTHLPPHMMTAERCFSYSYDGTG